MKFMATGSVVKFIAIALFVCVCTKTDGVQKQTEQAAPYDGFYHGVDMSKLSDEELQEIVDTNGQAMYDKHGEQIAAWDKMQAERKRIAQKSANNKTRQMAQYGKDTARLMGEWTAYILFACLIASPIIILIRHQKSKSNNKRIKQSSSTPWPYASGVTGRNDPSSMSANARKDDSKNPTPRIILACVVVLFSVILMWMWTNRWVISTSGTKTFRTNRWTGQTYILSGAKWFPISDGNL